MLKAYQKFALFIIALFLCYFVLIWLMPKRKVVLEYGDIVTLGTAVRSIKLAPGAGATQIVDFQYNHKTYSIQLGEDVDYYKYRLYYLVKIDTLNPEKSREHIRVKENIGLSANTTYIIGKVFDLTDRDGGSVVTICFPYNGENVCNEYKTTRTTELGDIFLIDPDDLNLTKSKAVKFDELLYHK